MVVVENSTKLHP